MVPLHRGQERERFVGCHQLREALPLELGGRVAKDPLNGRTDELDERVGRDHGDDVG